jgi:hypothetical protein
LWSSVGSERSQWSSFLATTDHFSSNWTSVVRGGKGDQLVVGRPGLVARLADGSGHRIAVDTHEPLGLANAASLGDVLEDGDGFLLGQVGMEQRSALTFGEPITAGATSEEADRVGLAGATADREVFPTSGAVIGALRIQTTTAREVIHGALSQDRGSERVFRGQFAFKCVQSWA